MQRPDRETQKLRRVVDQGRGDAFANHAQPFVDIGDNAAVGVEEPRIVDHDGGLLVLAYIVQRLGHRAVAGLLALDDFNQQHLFHRRKEVNADKLFRPDRRLGEARDRQGRGV